jgi:CBS-domain-containing membrane protein
MGSTVTSNRLLRHSINLAFPRPLEDFKERVSMDAPAYAVMTRMDCANIVTVQRGATIDAALAHMKLAGVRSAFVVNDVREVSGFITTYDIASEKPLRFLQSLDCSLHTCSRSDVHVEDIMEPIHQTLVVDVRELERRQVRDVILAFRLIGRTHIPVVEWVSPQQDRLCGMLSAADVGRKTGVDMIGLPRATTFSEIVQALGSGIMH